jgi:hypothetical protein
MLTRDEHESAERRAMRMAAVLALAASIAMTAAAKAASVDELFIAFGLIGDWAADCNQPAAPTNPHVRTAVPSAGLVLEDHDVGSDYAVNRYSMLSAARISATRLSVEVIFQPGAPGEERQKLVFLVRDGTRRTLFNQPEGGAVRVKDGIALAHGTKTPLLRKCE